MVQQGSSASYEDFTDDGHADELEPRDEGLREAVRTLVASVNATSRQFSEAAGVFAAETTRILEGFAERIEHSAVQTRDMAGLAGRAADEARRVSEALETKAAAASESVRAELQSLLGEARSRLEEALKTSGEAVEGVPRAPEDSHQRVQDASERAELSATASREAALAAETAAEAARNSADAIQAAASEAHERILAESNRVDAEAVTRFEQSMAASRDAAAAAERAAEDARTAALEAMSYASEAKAAPAAVPGAQELLGRLEADYELLTSLVQGLHSRISGLGAASATDAGAQSLAAWPDAEGAEGSASAPRDSVPATWTAVPVEPLTAQEPEPSQPGQALDSWTDAPPATQSPESQAAWAEAAHEPDTVQAQLEPAASATYAPEAGPSSWAVQTSEETPAGQPDHPWDAWQVKETTEAEAADTFRSDLEPESSSSAPALQAESGTPAAAAADEENGERPAWQATPALSPSDYNGATAAEALAPVQVPSPESSWDDTGETSANQAEKEHSPEPGVQTWDSLPVAVAPEASEAATPTLTASSQPGEAESQSGPGSEAEGGAWSEHESEEQSTSPLASGRLILHISPVPDFDRLLSLDGALGRLRFVHTVTLADYAKEEVTFRVELGEGTNLDDFTRELSQMSGQTLEVTFAEPGQLSLRIVTHEI